MKTESCRLYSRDFWIFLPNNIKIDRYNFKLYRFKVGPFFETQCSSLHKYSTCLYKFVYFSLQFLIIAQNCAARKSLLSFHCCTDSAQSYNRNVLKYEVLHIAANGVNTPPSVITGFWLNEMQPHIFLQSDIGWHHNVWSRLHTQPADDWLTDCYLGLDSFRAQSTILYVFHKFV